MAHYPDQLEPASSARRPVSSRSWVLTVLVLAYLSNYIDRTILYLLQESIKHEFNLTDTQVGLLGGTAFGIFYALCGVPIARLAERYGRVLVISISIVAWSVLTALCGAAQSFGQLMAARIGVAVGEAGGSPPAHSVIADYFPPQRRASALAIYSMSVPLGQMFGALLGGTIAHLAGWRGAFMIVGLPGLLLALLVTLTVKEPPRGYSDPDHYVPLDNQASNVRATVRHALRQRAFVHVMAGSTIAAFANFGVTNFCASFFLRNFNVGLVDVGLILSVAIGASSVFGTLMGGILVERLAMRRRRVYALLPAACFALCCPLYALGFLQASWLATMLLLVPPGILVTAHLGATYSIMHASFPAQMRATATSFMFLSHALISLTLGPLLVGVVSDAFTSWSFSGVDFASTCVGHGANMATAAATACRQASGAGLRYAIVVITPLFIWAAAHYYLASRHLGALRFDSRVG